MGSSCQTIEILLVQNGPSKGQGAKTFRRETIQSSSRFGKPTRKSADLHKLFEKAQPSGGAFGTAVCFRRRLAF